MDTKKRRLDVSKYFAVNLLGKRGGVALMWHSEKTMEVINYSNYHIHAKMQALDAYTIWWLTGFYGIQETNKR